MATLQSLKNEAAELRKKKEYAGSLTLYKNCGLNIELNVVAGKDGVMLFV